MKKIFTLPVVLVFVSAVNAQVEFGVKVGVNESTLTGKSASADVRSKTGYYAGITANFHLTKKLFLQPELLWSSQGNRVANQVLPYRSIVNYLQLPVMVRYQTRGFYAETGPEVGYFISGKGKFDNSHTTDLKNAYSSFSFSWGGGLGYEWKSGLGIGVRYNAGIGNVSESQYANTKFNVFKAGLSWKFKRNK